MRQLGPAFVESCIPVPGGGAAAKTLLLTAGQASRLASALLEDAKGAIYSAVVSFADALAGLQRGYFSWATVKLYYVCFYLAKAAVARRGYCVFYVGKTPFRLEAVAGASPHSQGGNSHTVVTSIYKSVVSSGLINAQPIDGVHAFDWLAKRREDVNYRELRFSDPVVPEWFAAIDDYGVRRVVGDYLADPLLYAFDAPHSMVALPLAVLHDESRVTLGFQGLGLSDDEAIILKNLFQDKSGPIHHFSFINGPSKAS